MNKTHLELLRLTKIERKTTAQILIHLQMIQDKKIYLKMGYSSILKYCIKEFNYSEAAAYRRIKTLKLMRDVPAVTNQLQAGEINLSQAAVAQGLFEAARVRGAKTKQDLLNSVKGLNAKEAESALRENLGLPKRKYQINLETSEETKNMWSELKQRSIHLGLSEADLFARIIQEKLLKLKSCEAKPLKKTNSKNQRYVSSRQRAYLLKRSNYSCEYLNKNSRKRCQSHFGLEVDHVRGIAQGGNSEVSNLRILCREHNQLR